MMIDFTQIKRIIKGYEVALLRRLLPHGKQQGNEYICLNPNRNDCHLGSFKVNLRSFKWADFATQSKGGDIISLWGYVRGINNFEAVKEILTILGKDIDNVSQQ